MRVQVNLDENQLVERQLKPSAMFVIQHQWILFSLLKKKLYGHP
jgi:hypothetical protein